MSDDSAPTPPADDPDRTVVMDPEGSSPGAGARVLARGLRLGRYVVLERLGGGGMGEVFAAYDPELDRRVALKVLHPRANDRMGSEGRARLLREARAIARLSDPHVVPVYDVGEIDGEVFMAMKLIEGQTLEKRVVGLDWRATLDLLVDAARGLSAAHRAGLVHRDVKPTNVLVDRHDHVVVMDFGLARAAPTGASGSGGLSGARARERSGAHARERTGPRERTRDRERTGPRERMRDGEPIVTIDPALSAAALQDPLESPLTEHGTVVGTLAYMAPEQHEGAAPDARADQFAFCVMAYEMLLGVRPFDGPTPDALLTAKRRGTFTPLPSERRIPGWLHRALVRGLAAHPDARHPDMEALVVELAHAPARRRRLAVAIAAVGFLVPMIALLPKAAAQPCTGSAERLVGTWDAARKDEVAARFADSPSAYASEAWPRVEAELDGYAQRWVAAHAEACAATHVRHERTGRELEATMACLDRRLIEFRALVDAFDRVDATTAEHAIGAVRELAAGGTCENEQPQAESPADPDALVAEADARVRVAEARALVMSGRYAEAIPVGEAAVAAARDAGADHVVVDALVVLGDAYDRTGRFADAEHRHTEAVRIAGPIGADDSAAQAAIRLVRNLAQEQSRFDEALAWARHAEGSIARVGRGGHREAELLAAYGVLHGVRADYPASRTAFEDALAIERSIDEESLEVAGLRSNLAVTLDQLALGDEAKREHLASLELTERLLGPSHPAVAQRLLDLGYTELTFAEPKAARGHFERALALLANVQDDTPVTARAFLGLGVSHSMLGEFATAEVHMREALVRFERMYGERHPWVARAYDDLGYLERSRGRPEISADMHRRALEIQIAVHGEDDAETARSRLMLGEALGEAGDHEAARRHFETSAKFFEARLGPEHPMVGQVHAQLGHAEAALGRPGHAREHFARALAIAQAASDLLHRIEAVAMQAEVAHCELELGRMQEALASSQRALATADELERDPSYTETGAIAWAYFVAAEAELAARADRQRALGLARASAERLVRSGRELPLAADVAELIESLEARGRRHHRH